MSGEDFVRTQTMLEVMADRVCPFASYDRRAEESEYGLSWAQFLEEFPREALADVQLIWDHADEALRRDLLLACRDKLTCQIQELQERYQAVERELHREVCAGAGSGGG